MNDKPLDLKNQETAYDRNKMEYLNLLSDQDIPCSHTEKEKECSKTLVNSASI